MSRSSTTGSPNSGRRGSVRPHEHSRPVGAEALGERVGDAPLALPRSSRCRRAPPSAPDRRLRGRGSPPATRGWKSPPSDSMRSGLRRAAPPRRASTSTSSSTTRSGSTRGGQLAGDEHVLERQPPAVALVGDGRTAEAVTDHMAARGERRAHHRADVLGPTRHHQQQLGSRVELAREMVEHQRADHLTERRAARFARQHRADRGRETPGLSRLAARLTTLEDDEPARSLHRARLRPRRDGAPWSAPSNGGRPA